MMMIPDQRTANAHTPYIVHLGKCLAEQKNGAIGVAHTFVVFLTK